MALPARPTRREPGQSSPAGAAGGRGSTLSGPVRPLAVAVGAAVLALVPAAVFTGAVEPLLLSDPGPFVRWGVPVADVVANLAGVATFGFILLAAFLAPERTHTDRRVTAMRWAGGTAVLWFLASLLELVLGFADVAGTPLTDPGLPQQFVRFAWELETTRVVILTTGAALVIALSAFSVTRRAPMAWLALLAMSGVVVQSLTGHAAGSASHEDAVNGLAVHLVGVTAWVGGLIALLAMRTRLGRDLGVTVSRYSVVATWSFAAVALSGVLQAAIRIGDLEGLLTAYGVVVVLKATALLVLGVIGWLHRRAMASRLRADPGDGRAFALLAVVEVAVMGLAAGLSAVLARSVPPVPDSLPDPGIVLTLTGYPDPGPMAWSDWYLTWRADWLFIALAVLAVGLYVAGVVRLHRRGDRWPWWRTLLWVCGWVLFTWATCSGPGIWGRVLFSVHMVMHMVVAMIVPILLVPAAPVTLALRALPARRDRTWGPRELLLQVVHSHAMQWVANPVVAAALFFFSLAAFYFTGLFGLALETHTGHLLMMAHFLLTGYLFVWVLIGIDPGPPRWSPLMLLVILFATISFHAFFGVALTGMTTLLAPDFFTQINLPWGPDPLADQYVAGEIAWGVGEAPTLILAVVVAVQWYRTEQRVTARLDRQADRDDDAALRAYNEHLDRLRREAERLD